MDVAGQMAALAVSGADQPTKVQQYTQLLDNLLSQGALEDLKVFVRTGASQCQQPQCCLQSESSESTHCCARMCS